LALTPSAKGGLNIVLLKACQVGSVVVQQKEKEKEKEKRENNKMKLI
jgi:hypothetical protein